MRSLLSKKRDTMLANAGVPEAKGLEAIFMPIGVHREYRGRGNAGLLANYLTNQLFNAGASRVCTRIAPDNIASLKLFKRFGWKDKKTSERWISVWIDRPDDFS